MTWTSRPRACLRCQNRMGNGLSGRATLSIDMSRSAYDPLSATPRAKPC